MAQTPVQTDSRAEKLSLLSTLLGPEAVARLRQDEPDLVPGAAPSLDPDRAAWHRNKLLERLRERRAETPAEATAGRVPSAPRSLDARLAANADPTEMAGEHPAIIARLLQGVGRADRIAALKVLPGPVARSVVRRLK